MKKLKIALAAVALTVVGGGAIASQSNPALEPCTPEQEQICIGNQADCCDLPGGGTLKFVFPEQ